MNLSLDKAELRKTILSQRKNLSLTIKQQASERIVQTILESPFYSSAKHIGLYFAFQGEVDLQTLMLRAWHTEKKTYFPVVQENKTLLFFEVSSTTPLKPNRFGIPEPVVTHPSVSLEILDNLFIPLVAFDDERYRLGMGQGYYDRTLAPLYAQDQITQVKTIGIGYAFQHTAALPREPWDIPLDMIITERYIWKG